METDRELVRERRSRVLVGRGTYQTGLLGEEAVRDGLRRAGWRILGHRARTRWGELDIVARRGDLLIFGEVKTTGRARGREHGELREMVDERKRHRLRRAAVAWMAAHPSLQHGVRRYRFDVFLVSTSVDGGGVERVDQVTDAF